MGILAIDLFLGSVAPNHTRPPPPAVCIILGVVFWLFRLGWQQSYRRINCSTPVTTTATANPTTSQVGIGMDRFRVPELLVDTSPLTDALSGNGSGGAPSSPGLRALADSLTRPGFPIRPLQASIFVSRVFARFVCAVSLQERAPETSQSNLCARVKSRPFSFVLAGLVLRAR